MAANNGGGYALSVLPQIGQVDPRLFNTGGQLLGGLNQGLGAYQSLQNISDQAQAEPIKRQLQQISLDEARARIAQAPLEQRLKLAQISEAEQNAALPRILPGDVTLEDQTVTYPSAFDENGERTGPADVVTGDLVKLQQEQLIGPGGVITPRTVRSTVKTAAQRDAEAALQAANVRAKDALSAKNTRGKEFEAQQLIESYNSALDDNDPELAALYRARIDRLNAMPGILQDGTTFRRRMEQNAADAGVTLTQATELSKTPQGMAALTQLAIANKAAAKSPFGAPVLTADQQALIQASAGGVAPGAALPFQQRAEQILAPQTNSAVTVRTKAEYDVLPAGTKYIGPDGITKIKK